MHKGTLATSCRGGPWGLSGTGVPDEGVKAGAGWAFDAKSAEYSQMQALPSANSWQTLHNRAALTG